MDYYDGLIERGTCPRCGSGAVTHLCLRADPFAGEHEPLPAWVADYGCMAPPHARECDWCGAAWNTPYTESDREVRLGDRAGGLAVIPVRLSTVPDSSGPWLDVVVLNPFQVIRHSALSAAGRWLTDLADVVEQASRDPADTELVEVNVAVEGSRALFSASRDALAEAADRVRALSSRQ